MVKEGPAEGYKKLPSILASKPRYRISQQIKHLHDSLHPEIYFVTQTSATGAGYMIKEIYKTAWPNEPVPKILTIDPRPLTTKIHNENITQRKFDDGELDNSEKFRELVSKTKDKLEKLNNYGIKNNIAVIDEGFMISEGLESGFGWNIDPSGDVKTWQVADRIVRVARGELGLKGKVAPGGFGDRNRSFSSYWIRENNSDKYHHATKKKIRNYTTGQDIDKTEIELAKYNVNRLKKLGIELGEEIRQEEQKKKSLEDKLSVFITIAGIGLGLFLIFSNFSSGNVQLSPGENIFNWELFSGIGLLIVGIVSGLFYFKRKKNLN